MLLSYSPKGACAFAGWRGVCVSQCVCMCLTSREGYRVHSRYATHHERYVRVSVTFGLVQLAPAYLLLFCFCFSFVAYPFIAVFFLFPAGRPATRDVVFVCHVRRGSRRKTTNTKRTQRTEEEDQARISIKRFNPNPNSYVVYSDLRIEGGSQRSSPSPSLLSFITQFQGCR